MTIESPKNPCLPPCLLILKRNKNTLYQYKETSDAHSY